MVTRRRRFLPGLCAVLMAAAGISWAQTRAPQATDVAGLVAEVRVADKLRKLDILAQLHAAIRSNGVGLDVVRAAAPSLAHDEARARLSSVSLISMAAGNARGPGDEAVRREAFRLLAAHVKTEPAHRVRKLIAHALPRTRVAQAVSILTDMSLEPNYEVAHTALAALGRLGDRRPDLLPEITPFLIDRLAMAIAEPHVGIIDGTAGATIEALGELDDERVLTPIEEAYRVSPMDVGGSCVGAWGRIALRNRNPVVDGPPRTGHPLEVTSVGRARAEAWLHEALANPYEVTRAEAADWIQMVVRADIDYAEDLVEFGTDAEQPPEQE